MIGEGAWWMATAAIVSGLITTAIPGFLPHKRTADFFEVHEIYAQRAGTGADMYVDRTIKAPVQMSFVVRILGWTGAGWKQVCIMEGGPLLYRPDAVIDNPVSLDWWTNGKCPELPSGRAMIETTWKPVGLAPLTVSVEVE